MIEGKAHKHALARARELCESVGTTLDAVIEAALPDGVVWISPECVGVGEVRGPVLELTLAVGSGALHRLCALAPRSIVLLAWSREAKGRPQVVYFSRTRVQKLLPRHEKAQASAPSARGTPGGHALL